MIREQQFDPRWILLDDFTTTAPCMIEASIKPVNRRSDKTRLYWIFINIRKGEYKCLKSIEDTGMEAISPDMPREVVISIIRRGENPKNPTHDYGEALALRWLDEKMDVITHDAEVPDMETILLFRADRYPKEEIAGFSSLEEHLFSIDACGHMVPSAFA